MYFCYTGKALLTFSKNQSVEINPWVSFRMLIFNGLPTLAEYTLKGLVLEINRQKEKGNIVTIKYFVDLHNRGSHAYNNMHLPITTIFGRNFEVINQTREAVFDHFSKQR